MSAKRISLMILALLMLSATLGCLAEAGDGDDMMKVIGGNETLAFRPVDCGVQAQSLYSFPFIGLELELSKAMCEKMDSREVFVFSQEDYAADGSIAYALLRFSATTQGQREVKGMSVDIFAWEEALARFGAIGVYQKDVVARLDELTGCDSHRQIGESVDGAYAYYLSINSNGDAALAKELQTAEILITEMHLLDLSLGYTAFSDDRVEGVSGVGSFVMEDVFGNACDQSVFADYDLTLVNVFTTWCSPCVNEMLELEALRKACAENGVSLGVLAVVMDVKTDLGMDEGALERAQLLHERSGVQFPFVIPDNGMMNSRLTGIESFPESFFVDRQGNIVSEAYIGAHSQREWSEIVDAEFERLAGENG